jgi:uncharacterized membrane protein
MDQLWRFFRTVGWASVGAVFVLWVIVPLLEAAKVGDMLAAKEAVVVGGLTVVGAGIFAVLTTLVQRNAAQTTPLQRALYQFGQTALAGALAPIVADTLVDTAVNYGKSLWVTMLTALVAAVQAFIVNQREASPAPTPEAVPATRAA